MRLQPLQRGQTKNAESHIDEFLPRREGLFVDEVQQRPQLLNVVLDRCAGQQDAVLLFQPNHKRAGGNPELAV